MTQECFTGSVSSKENKQSYFTLTTELQTVSGAKVSTMWTFKLTKLLKTPMKFPMKRSKKQKH